MCHCNVLVGGVTAVGPARVAAIAIGSGYLVCRIPQQIAVGREVTVMLRYEKVEIVSGGSETDGTAQRGTLLEQTYMGPTVRRRIKIEGLGELIADASNADSLPELKVGAPVVVRWGLDAPSVLTE